MSEIEYITEHSAERRFFVIIPNIVDDVGLSANALRLYLHLKRVAGEDGCCWQSTQTLADHCKMARNTIVRAKRELVEAGLIEVLPRKRAEGGLDYHEIRIVDIWRFNNWVCSPDCKPPANLKSHTLQGMHFEPCKSQNAYLKKNTVRKTHEKEPTTATAVAFTRILKIFEDNLVKLAPHQKRELKKFLDTLSEEAIIEALRDTVLRNKFEWRYIRAILRRYQREGFQPSGVDDGK